MLLALPFLSVCGPSKAELAYEEYIKTLEETRQRVEAEQQAQKEKELADIRDWCIEVAMIIRNDSELIDAWSEFLPGVYQFRKSSHVSPRSQSGYRR